MKQKVRAESFEKGMRVRFCPSGLRECQKAMNASFGVVAGAGTKFVFVKYDTENQKMITGDEPVPSKATLPENLELWHK